MENVSGPPLRQIRDIQEERHPGLLIAYVAVHVYFEETAVLVVLPMQLLPTFAYRPPGFSMFSPDRLRGGLA